MKERHFISSTNLSIHGKSDCIRYLESCVDRNSSEVSRRVNKYSKHVLSLKRSDLVLLLTNNT